MAKNLAATASLDGQLFSKRRSLGKWGAILDAAETLFLDAGYVSTCMEQIAARARVSKVTVYSYFSCKADLFATVVRRQCASFNGLACPDEGQDARAVLTLWAERLMAFMMSPGAMGLYRVMTSEALRCPDLVGIFFESGPASIKANLAEGIRRLVLSGALEGIDAPDLIAGQYIGMLCGETYQRSLLGLPGERSVEATVEGAVETIMRAYGPRRG